MSRSRKKDYLLQVNAIRLPLQDMKDIRILPYESPDYIPGFIEAEGSHTKWREKLDFPLVKLFGRGHGGTIRDAVRCASWLTNLPQQWRHWKQSTKKTNLKDFHQYVRTGIMNTSTVALLFDNHNLDSLIAVLEKLPSVAYRDWLSAPTMEKTLVLTNSLEQPLLSVFWIVSKMIQASCIHHSCSHKSCQSCWAIEWTVLTKKSMTSIAAKHLSAQREREFRLGMIKMAEAEKKYKKKLEEQKEREKQVAAKKRKREEELKKSGEEKRRKWKIWKEAEDRYVKQRKQHEETSREEEQGRQVVEKPLWSSCFR